MPVGASLAVRWPSCYYGCYHTTPSCAAWRLPCRAYFLLRHLAKERLVDSSQFSAETNILDVNCSIHICWLTVMKTELSKPVRLQALRLALLGYLPTIVSGVNLSLFRTLALSQFVPLEFSYNCKKFSINLKIYTFLT